MTSVTHQIRWTAKESAWDYIDAQTAQPILERVGQTTWDKVGTVVWTQVGDSVYAHIRIHLREYLTQ